MPHFYRRSSRNSAPRRRPSRLGELMLGLGLSLVLVMLPTEGPAAQENGRHDTGRCTSYYIWRDKRGHARGRPRRRTRADRADGRQSRSTIRGCPAATHTLLPTMHILPRGPRRGSRSTPAELRLYYYDAEDGYFSFPLGVGRDGYLTPRRRHQDRPQEGKAIVVPDAVGDPRPSGVAARDTARGG